jgi:hypothetical protein
MRCKWMQKILKSIAKCGVEGKKGENFEKIDPKRHISIPLYLGIG